MCAVADLRGHPTQYSMGFFSAAARVLAELEQDASLIVVGKPNAPLFVNQDVSLHKIISELERT